MERIDHVPPGDHAAFYSRLRFALNITRADMMAAGWSPSVRLFEATACGTAVLTDRWEGLSDFFPEGKAIGVVDDCADIVAALSGAEEDKARRMADRAREITLGAHTSEHRARQLEAAIAAAKRPCNLRDVETRYVRPTPAA